MVLAFVVAAVVTPPDVISQLALAIPMCLLYEVGIIGAGWFSKVSKKPGDEEAEPVRCSLCAPLATRGERVCMNKTAVLLHSLRFFCALPECLNDLKTRASGAYGINDCV